MRKFLESLFGTSKGQANMQDIRVSKECRLFVSVESASNIVCYAAKGLVQVLPGHLTAGCRMT